MSYSTLLRCAFFVVIAVALTTVTTILVLSRAHNPDTQVKADRDGFHEEAEKAGITFRMTYLPDEQGVEARVNLYDHGCGVAVGDYNGDGLDDLYFCNQLGKNALYRNNGDGTFTDVTEKAGVGVGDRVCVAATWADTRNIGRQDLYVTTTRGGNILFRNNGDGTFTDVTEQAGLADKEPTHSQTAAFFDYDNDGFLDLLVSNTARWTLEQRKNNHHFRAIGMYWDMVKSPVEHNVLYHNNGDGTFNRVTQSGLEGPGWGGDVAVFDYDEDGYMDVFVTHMFGASQLYRNNHDGTFTNVTQTVLGRTSWGAIGCKAFDFNNDGRLDLLVTDMHSDMWLNSYLDPRKISDNVRRKYPHLVGPTYNNLVKDNALYEEQAAKIFNIQYDRVLFGNTLFQTKQSSGQFEEVSDRAGMETFWPWGITTGDYDNDGFEDVYIPSGMGFPFYYWPSALMMNNGNGTFTDRAKELGLDPPPDGEYGDKIGKKPTAHSSRCGAVGDFTGKGRLDLVINNFNNRAYLYRNHFPQKNYVAFRLTGTKCNRDAIGAVVRLHVGDQVMVRQVQTAGGYLSQSSKTLHFGLGDHSQIDRIEVTWPGRTTHQVIADRTINTLHTITKPRVE